MRRDLRIRWMLAVFAAAIVLWGPGASASLLYEGGGTNSESGNDLGASVLFDWANGTLTVVLTNTGDAASMPSDVLTAVFFTLDGATLTPGSAVITDGSGVIPTSAYKGDDVGGEWAFRDDISTSETPYDVNSGISSSGLGGLYGSADRFNTATSADLWKPPSPDGVQGGLVNGVNNPNGGLADTKNPVIDNSVTFLFSYTGVLTDASFSNIWFQYGTSAPAISGGEPSVPADHRNGEDLNAPEPATMLLLGLSLVGLAARKKLFLA